MRWPKSSAPSKGHPRLLWLGSLGVASAMTTAKPSGREIMLVSTVGCEEEHLRRSRRNQEHFDAQGRDEDGDFEESLRTCIWQPLGLLTTVKPPALRERHDLCFSKQLWVPWSSNRATRCAGIGGALGVLLRSCHTDTTSPCCTARAARRVRVVPCRQVATAAPEGWHPARTTQ
jgi:hypothetical protein